MSKKQTISFYITLCLFLFVALQTVAQNRTRLTWLSFNLGHHQYHGDLGSEILDFRLGYDWTIGLTLDRYISNRLDVKISTSYGELDYNNFFNTSFLNSQLLLEYKFLSNRQVLNPFVGSGVGITNFRSSGAASYSGVSLHIPLQIGVDYQLKENIYTSIHATYNRSFSDEIDGGDFGSKEHDDFMVYAVGIKFSLSKSRDSDGDGVKNKNDCALIPTGHLFGDVLTPIETDWMTMKTNVLLYLGKRYSMDVQTPMATGWKMLPMPVLTKKVLTITTAVLTMMRMECQTILTIVPTDQV
jgi:hypothetical protein